MTGATRATFDVSSTFVAAKVRATVTATNKHRLDHRANRRRDPDRADPGRRSRRRGSGFGLGADDLGGLAQDQVLSSSTGSWSNNPISYAYQWQWSSTGLTWLNVTGATRATFDVSSTFAGTKVHVTVTATNTAGSAIATSAAVSPTPTVPHGRDHAEEHRAARDHRARQEGHGAQLVDRLLVEHPDRVRLPVAVEQ